MAGGPVTRYSASVALGLARILIGASAANIATRDKALSADDSIGSLATTKLMATSEFWKHESGFPLKEDISIPTREGVSMECQFEELTPFNIALARGLDSSALGMSKTTLSGEINLGGLTSPAYIRMEAEYTYPDGIHMMNIVFPRAQITSNLEVDLQKEDNAKPPIVIESKIASSEVSGGSAVWDNSPLGRIYWT